LDVQVAADVVEAGLADPGIADPDAAADVVDRQLPAADALDVHRCADGVHGHRRARGHGHLQPAGLGPVAATEPAAALRITHLDVERIGAAVDVELLDALAQRAGDAHFGAVPGAN